MSWKHVHIVVPEDTLSINGTRSDNHKSLEMVDQVARAEVSWRSVHVGGFGEAKPTQNSITRADVRRSAREERR